LAVNLFNFLWRHIRTNRDCRLDLPGLRHKELKLVRNRT
jgi:hypothetical protein